MCAVKTVVVEVLYTVATATIIASTGSALPVVGPSIYVLYI
jgi:hypothetical protein